MAAEVAAMGGADRTEDAGPGGTTLEVWEVYARHDREERAHHLGTVRAVSPSDARVFAVMMYDERRWQEMFVIPRAAVIPVIVPE